jgi:hypothetical protein
LVTPRTPFPATEFFPQVVIHTLIDTPGKVITHVRIQNAWIYRIYLSNVVPTSQTTIKTKTSVGVELNRESIYITHIATDEDGSLKIKKIEDFTDSKAELDFYQAIAATGVKKQ